MNEDWNEEFSRYYVEMDSNVLDQMSATLKNWRRLFKEAYDIDVKSTDEMRKEIIDLDDEDCDLLYGHLYNQDFNDLDLDDVTVITTGEDNSEIEASDEFLNVLDKLSNEDRQTAYAELDNVNVQTARVVVRRVLDAVC